MPTSAATATTGALFAQTDDFIKGGLSSRAHLFIFIATAIALVFIFRLVRRRSLAGKYAVLWTGVAVVLAVVAIFPNLLTTLSEWVQVSYPPALFLLLTTGLLFIVVIHFSWELSRLEDRTRTLAEEVALLRAQHPDTAALIDAARAGAAGPSGDEDRPGNGAP